MTQVTVSSVKGMKRCIIVTGETAARVRQALRLLSKGNKKNQKAENSDEIEKALKLYRMNQKFFKQNGRFKKPYKQTRKKKPAAKKAAAAT